LLSLGEEENTGLWYHMKTEFIVPTKLQGNTSAIFKQVLLSLGVRGLTSLFALGAIKPRHWIIMCQMTTREN
jgi:hypothetical protein